MLSIQFPPADVDQGMTQTSYPGFCDDDRKSLKVPLFEREPRNDAKCCIIVVLLN